MVFLTLKTLNKPNLFRCWNLRTSSLRSSEFLFRASERLLKTSVLRLGQKLLSYSLTFLTIFLVKGVIVEGPTHLTEFPLHRTSAVFYTSVDSTSEMGCGLFLLCNSLVGTVTATRVSDVGGSRRQSCVTTFTRGRNLMVLGIWKRLNGRFISEPSLRIPNFIRSHLNPLIKPSIF